MSKDKNILTLVGKSERDKFAAQRKVHMERMLSQVNAGDSYIMITIDKDGYAEFITDMDLYEANFQLDKVKMNLVLGPDDGEGD